MRGLKRSNKGEGRVVAARRNITHCVAALFVSKCLVHEQNVAFPLQRVCFEVRQFNKANPDTGDTCHLYLTAISGVLKADPFH